jgi:hypothetical protein
LNNYCYVLYRFTCYMFSSEISICCCLDSRRTGP